MCSVREGPSASTEGPGFKTWACPEETPPMAGHQSLGHDNPDPVCLDYGVDGGWDGYHDLVRGSTEGPW